MSEQAKAQQNNEKVKHLTYLERLKQPSTERDIEELQHQSDSAKLQLESDILATKKSLKNAERELEASKSAVPFNVENISNKKDEVDALQRGLEYLKELHTELF